MKLNKRILRELINNKTRYIGLFLLTILSVMIIVGYSSSADSIINSVEDTKVENNLEDGHFSVFKNLDDKTSEQIEDLGIQIQEEFYTDFTLQDEQVLRVYKERSDINKLSLVEGKEISGDKDIILDKNFSKVNNYAIGDSISINNESFDVSGYGITPDYTCILKEISDMLVNHDTFGIGYVNEDGFDKISTSEIIYSYSYVFKDENLSEDDQKAVLSDMQEIIKDGNVLTGLYKTDNNQRVTFYKDKLTLNKSVSVLLGIILIVIIAFMISISVIHIIEEDSAIIGALYSMGYIRKEIVRHYMWIPLTIVFSGSVIGTILGVTVINKVLMSTPASYFNFPEIKLAFSPFLAVVGIVVPLVITFVVNYISLIKKLSLSPLKLLRKEGKKEKYKQITLKKFNFLTKFKLRIFLREIKNYVIVFVGILFSILLLLMGLGMKDSLANYPVDVENTIQNEYTYYLKAPYDAKDDSVENVVDVSASLEQGKRYYITLRGVNENSNYIDCNIPSNESGVYISDAVSKKFDVEVGDTIKVKDQNTEEEYSLDIIGICDYSSGLYIFMNFDQLNELAGNKEGFYNVLLSNKEIDVPDDYLFKCVSKDDFIAAAESAVNANAALVGILVIAAIAVSIITLYLILKLIADRSQNNISLIKIFGYQNNEVNKIFLGSALIVVIVSILISIPVCRVMVSGIWPKLIAGIQGYINFKLNIASYVMVIVIIMGTYLVSDLLLKCYLKKISFVQILKDRE